MALTRWIVVLVAAYFVAGRAALLLAIPPGYATAVWPSSGIALGAVLMLGRGVWPGILLGSMLVNLPTAQSLPVALGIGVGAALQALLGAWLIERFVPRPYRLVREEEVGWFLALGGPISSLVNALWAPLVLLLSGRIAAPELGFNMWTWWVGDTIGVILVAPLMVAWADLSWRSRRVSVTVPLVLCMALTVGFFVYASARESYRIQLEFERRAAEVASRLQADLGAYVEALYAVRNLMQSVAHPDPATFRSFVTGTVDRHPGIIALSWVPQVPHARRAEVEAGIGRTFSELSPDGSLVPCGTRSEYYPVVYIEPMQGNEAVMGFDLGSSDMRLQTLMRSYQSRAVATSSPLRLIQDVSNHIGVMVALPVYGADGVLRGFVTAPFRLRELLQTSLRHVDYVGMSVRLVDTAESGRAATLAYVGEATSDLLFEAELPFGGRGWALQLSPTRVYMAGHRSWSAWSVLAGGLLFSGLLGAFMLVITGRTIAVEEIVDQRTAELRNSEARLKVMVEEQRGAHAIRGAVAILTEGEVVTLLQTLEEQAARGDLAAAADSLRHIEPRLQSLLAALLRWKATHQ